DAQPKVGRCEQGETDHAHGVVGGAPSAPRGQEPGWNAEQECQEQGEGDQFERCGQSMTVVGSNRATRDERCPQVEANGAFDVVGVLIPERTIEAELVASLTQKFWRGKWPDNSASGVAGDDAR